MDHEYASKISPTVNKVLENLDQLPEIDMTVKEMEGALEVLQKYVEQEYGEAAVDEVMSSPATRRGRCRCSRRSIRRWLTDLGMNVAVVKAVLSLVLLTSYCCLGGLMFMYVESDAQHEAIQANIQYNEVLRTDYIANLTSLINNLNPGIHCDVNCTSELWNFVYETGDVPGARDEEEDILYNWHDFTASVFYTATLLTTIGFGNICPHTKAGQLLTIPYSVIGIPIMIVCLHNWAQILFAITQYLWIVLLRCVRRQAKRWRHRINGKVRNREYVRKKSKSVPVKFVNFLSAKKEEDLPMWLAITVVVLYSLGITLYVWCSEDDWDFIESLYFVFISLSTIGLGDYIPHHPSFMTASFPLFIGGLALTALCISVLGARIEARYMAALRLVEQQAHHEKAVAVHAFERQISNSTVNKPKSGITLIDALHLDEDSRMQKIKEENQMQESQQNLINQQQSVMMPPSNLGSRPRFANSGSINPRQKKISVALNAVMNTRRLLSRQEHSFTASHSQLSHIIRDLASESHYVNDDSLQTSVNQSPPNGPTSPYLMPPSGHCEYFLESDREGDQTPRNNDDDEENESDEDTVVLPSFRQILRQKSSAVW